MKTLRHDLGRDVFAVVSVLFDLARRAGRLSPDVTDGGLLLAYYIRNQKTELKIRSIT
jgi:hypothetical protein|tara:strand:- start:171 stop:344 length:174 start_codon:yes stop_codon:yes gene_type:complete